MAREPRKQLDRGECQHAIMPKLKIIFVTAGKCASGSLKRQARRSQGDLLKIPKSNVVLSDYFKISIWREPVARLASCYSDKIARFEVGRIKKFYDGFKFVEGIEKGMSFAQFATVVCNLPDSKSDAHFRSQHCYYTDNGKNIFDILIDIDELPEAWELVKAKGLERGVNVPDIIQEGRRTGKKHRVKLTEITPEIRRMIEDRYKKDYELRGFISHV